MKLASRAALKRLATAGALGAAAALGAGWYMFAMPGNSHEGPLPRLTADQSALAERLRADVSHLAAEIGPRHVGTPAALAAAAGWIEASLAEAGLDPEREPFEAAGHDVANIVAPVPAAPGEASAAAPLVVGAHYDTVPGCPGANDNGSGVAALLAVARRLAADPPAGPVRIVAFVNEEPPFFRTAEMGSLVHARGAAERGEAIAGMISLETIGYYSNAPGSQAYPAGVGPWFPDAGRFLAFVGNLGSRDLLRRAIGAFRARVAFPSQGAALPAALEGVGLSDHWSFWQIGAQAIMVTDTAPFRYPHYHEPTDTPERLDYERLARVVIGLEATIRRLAGPETGP